MADSEGFVKGGEEKVRFTIRRSKSGILVNVQTHSDIERALREDWSTGEPMEIREFGPDWLPVGKDKLFVYSLANDPGPVNYGQDHYALSKPGRGFLVDDARQAGVGGSGSVVNLGLLRLVGTSSGAGVTFELKGVFSYPSIRNTLSKLTEASKRFYIDYLLDIELTVKIVTQETRL